MNLTRTSSKIRGIFFQLIRDAESLAALRILLLSVVICLALLYTGNSILLAPHKEQLAKVAAENSRLQQSYPGIADGTAVEILPALNQRLEKLKNQLALKRLKTRLFQEQWSALGDQEQFSRTIFTIDGSAPVDLSKSLDQADYLEPRSNNDFIYYPMLIRGKAEFTELYSYLKYLENKQVVGMITGLKITAENSDPVKPAGPMNFELEVSRVRLAE